MSKKISWSFSRIPLDFATLFNKSHIPLIKETPLTEVLEVARRLDKIKPGEKTAQLVNFGLESATLHMQSDYNQLSVFDYEWKSGRYFNTKTGTGSLRIRASSIWFDADKYLEILKKLRETKMLKERKKLFLERTNDNLAESTLDLATKILKEYGHISDGQKNGRH